MNESSKVDVEKIDGAKTSTTKLGVNVVLIDPGSVIYNDSCLC